MTTAELIRIVDEILNPGPRKPLRPVKKLPIRQELLTEQDAVEWAKNEVEEIDRAFRVWKDLEIDFPRNRALLGAYRAALGAFLVDRLDRGHLATLAPFARQEERVAGWMRQLSKCLLIQGVR